ncbi:uncharacterized protein C10orf95-like [Suncus etruscus]|uniref:uncharacterized protein C10orf95-like n=1 Tax=Suncus etruscus TaxID=109475 RepID=UPI00210FA6D6|nr:uncharacterized protein C10orf95-like [Suncus etruscus]
MQRLRPELSLRDSSAILLPPPVLGVPPARAPLDLFPVPGAPRNHGEPARSRTPRAGRQGQRTRRHSPGSARAAPTPSASPSRLGPRAPPFPAGAAGDAASPAISRRLGGNTAASAARPRAPRPHAGSFSRPQRRRPHAHARPRPRAALIGRRARQPRADWLPRALPANLFLTPPLCAHARWRLPAFPPLSSSSSSSSLLRRDYLTEATPTHTRPQRKLSADWLVAMALSSSPLCDWLMLELGPPSGGGSEARALSLSLLRPGAPQCKGLKGWFS